LRCELSEGVPTADTLPSSAGILGSFTPSG
jgi:hypothetical protein